MNILYSASGVLTVFFMLLLLSKKGKSLADYILAGWFCLILLVIVTTYVNYNQLEVWQGLFELTDSSVFLHGPLIWFYTLALTDQNFRFRTNHFWHFLPFLFSVAFLIYPILVGEAVTEANRYLILVLKMLHLLCYGIAVLIQLKRHERNITNFFSNTERIELSWLKLLTYSLIVIWIISVVSQVAYAVGDLAIPQYGGFFTNMAVSVLVLVIGYFGIRQTTIFTPAHLIAALGDNRDILDKRVGKTLMDDDGVVSTEASNPILKKHYSRLQNLMIDKKPYLNGNLTLYTLATQMQLSSHQLSHIINREAGKSFFDFVNSYRVEAVKERIRKKDYEHLTLLAIALDSGFNSKASFNRVFKKMTGLTPREYVQKH